VTRLFLIGAAIFASACSFHTHETVVVQPAQPRPVYVAAPRDAVVVNHPGRREREPSKRRPPRARPASPATPPPRGTAARPDPKPHPRPYVDRKHPPRRKMVVCTREVEKRRKECMPKSGHKPVTLKRDG
jgi:hypothetical protein